MDAFLGVSSALPNNPRLAWQARFADFSIALDNRAGDAVAIAVRSGSATAAKGDIPDADIRLIADQASWDQYLSAAPAPGYQNLLSMFSIHQLDVIGDQLAMYRYLFLIEGLLSSVRAAAPLQLPQGRNVTGLPSIDPVIGRYLRLEIDGKPHSIYFEEAGQGIPLLCLHTAGSDGRQYRALLRDSEITSRFRVIAFDLPWHGKSSPPAGFERELYLLTTERYMEIVIAVTRALQLDRPVVMGCSIGGRAVLHISMRYGNDFRAAIGLQSALYAEVREMAGAPGLEHLYRPDTYGSEVGAASVATIMAPNSPPVEYWETLWYYMQSGPGVFMGDLYYYFSDGDLRNGGLCVPDGARCPLYLLTGEYDLSATPEMTAELAREVNAEHFEVMKKLGHFPMSENPELFRTYLLPVLDMIRARDTPAPADEPLAASER